MLARSYIVLLYNLVAGNSYLNFYFLVFDGAIVKHYRIRQEDGEGFFLSKKKTFKTLNAFVDHYTNNSDGLCVKLGKPCTKVKLILNCANYIFSD